MVFPELFQNVTDDCLPGMLLSGEVAEMLPHYFAMTVHSHTIGVSSVIFVIVPKVQHSRPVAS